jgi:hypothetical protein
MELKIFKICLDFWGGIRFEKEIKEFVEEKYEIFKNNR